MPNSSLAEIYFIAAMMILILIVSGAACFFFFRTYRREMKAKEGAKKQKSVRNQKSETRNPN